MCLEVRTKTEKTLFIVLPNRNLCGMCPYEKSISIQDDRLNEVQVNTMLRYQLQRVTKKINHAMTVKKEAWQKYLAASQP